MLASSYRLLPRRANDVGSSQYDCLGVVAPNAVAQSTVYSIKHVFADFPCLAATLLAYSNIKAPVSSEHPPKVSKTAGLNLKPVTSSSPPAGIGEVGCDRGRGP